MNDLKVNITYKHIKNLHLRVKNGEIYISAPYFTSKDFINKFINNNLDFVYKQLAKQESKKLNDIKINDHISILNKEYQILNISTKKIKITDHFIFVNENYDIKKQIKLLFKDLLYKYLYDLTLYYFKMMNLSCSFPKIVVKDVKSKWGSYDRKNHQIIYSLNILFKDLDVYDYLVVHELAHIVEFNHSKNFYNVVSKYCKDYKVLRKKLKEM